MKSAVFKEATRQLCKSNIYCNSFVLLNVTCRDIGLDSYILNSLNYLNLIWIYISHCMTSLLKLAITV